MGGLIIKGRNILVDFSVHRNRDQKYSTHYWMFLTRRPILPNRSSLSRYWDPVTQLVRTAFPTSEVEYQIKLSRDTNDYVTNKNRFKHDPWRSRKWLDRLEPIYFITMPEEDRVEFELSLS
jgi:hypothetical protein